MDATDLYSDTIWLVGFIKMEIRRKIHNPGTVDNSKLLWQIDCYIIVINYHFAEFSTLNATINTDKAINFV